MKLACASSAFHQSLASGDLTQLEWLDLCARELAVDGVVCDVRHFPRRDSDYLAQVKKMAVDSGLTVAAICCEDFFAGDEGAMRDALAVADLIGAPIIAAPLELETATSWSTELERIGRATSLCKTMNITLAVRNREKTFAASTHDLKRVSKEADSAWLRYSLDFAAFDAGSDPAPLMQRAVLLWHEHEAGESDSDETPLGDRFMKETASYRGFFVLDSKGGGSNAHIMRNAARKWRTLFAQEILGQSIGG
jgi:sugar phosphate isomerase/epimerase